MLSTNTVVFPANFPQKHKGTAIEDAMHTIASGFTSFTMRYAPTKLAVKFTMRRTKDLSVIVVILEISWKMPSGKPMPFHV
jgi:hypothetical protein